MNVLSRFILLGLIFLAASFSLSAQEKTNPSPRNANYNINVELDTEKKVLNGQMELIWKNISQDTINELQFHLYLNAFKNNRTTFMTESGGSFRGDAASKDDLAWGYIDILDIRFKGGESLNSKIEFIQPDDGNKYDQTVMRIQLSNSILPGQEVNILCNFKSKLPKIFARTGFA
ncbi:MAG: hypothetical protein P1P88_17040, partial [Bacteroidales bacterium]|nr:hypothetical protein [Bacteroidales bacterium]